jgi:hypothetical protein
VLEKIILTKKQLDKYLKRWWERKY